MQGLEIANDKKFNKEKVECYLLLSTAFEKVNTKTALEYYKQALIVKDSLFNQDKQKQLLSYKFNEELRQSEIRNARQLALNKNKIVVLLVLLLCLVLIAIILVRNNRHKQKLNVLLQQQKDEIQSNLRELKATQSQLIQSEKMASLGELTAGIAHEIQNPLNFVNNFSEINKELLGDLSTSLEQGNLEDAKALTNDLLANEEKIHHHGNRADGIVKGMLQHSRNSPGIKEKTDFNKLVDEYVRLANNGLRVKDKLFTASLVTDFDKTIGDIPVIPQDIGRVILNLINNAFYAVNEKNASAFAKANNYEPTVSIVTKKLVNKVEVDIRDNGNGIPQQIIDKIFQPFFTTKPTGQGTGLGLSIAYDIIKAHGGEIRAESKEGEGSVFVITLPA
nr:ATP-binding protein [Flavihumibacter fluvii]